MPDVVTPEVRSRMMAGIRGKNTKPEMLLRSELHKRGLRFRIHDNRLPGRPDIVFPGRHAVLMVNGCFWHAHEGCRYFNIPETRREFWVQKFEANRARDKRDESALAAAGWRVGVVWECATRRDVSDAIDVIERWVRSESSSFEIPS